MAPRQTNKQKLTAAVARWIEAAQGRADGLQALARRAAWMGDQLAILGRDDLEVPTHLEGLTAADLICAQGDLERAALGLPPMPPPVVTAVETRPPLPSRKIAHHPGELSRDLHVIRDGDAYALQLAVWECDRRGDKDVFTGIESRHATLGAATAAMNAYGAQAVAA